MRIERKFEKRNGIWRPDYTPRRQDLERFERYRRRYSAALAVAQAANNNSTAATATTITVTTSAGSLLVVYSGQGANNTSTLAMSDSASNTWSQTSSGYSSANTSSRAAMFFVANAAAVTSITCTWSGSLSTTVSAVVFEITGAVTSTPEDSSVNSNSNTAGTTANSGSLTTTNANDILIFGARTGSDVSAWTAGTSYAIPTNGSNVRVGMQYLIVSSTQSAVTTSISWTTSATHAEVFAGFKAAAAAAAMPPLLHRHWTLNEAHELARM